MAAPKLKAPKLYVPTKAFFPEVQGQIRYEGPASKNPLAFKHYNPGEVILGKTMRDHLRFAVCYWHTLKGLASDQFGPETFIREYNKSNDPMTIAYNTLDAAFEFFTKLGVNYWCFHDRDIAPEADNLRETNARLDKIVEKAKQLQKETGMRNLWGTTNAFSHRRFMAGAGTNPSPEVYAYTGAQMKKAIEITKELGGEGYVFWGGREGYDTLLNTMLGLELGNMANLLGKAVEHKKSIGFDGQFYIEPKPQEPTKHQYDSDVGNCYAFLQRHGLDKDFKINVEANHATLAGHDFVHELALAATLGILGSVDANRGDTMLGWDTDQFPTNVYDTTLAMDIILGMGGFTTGGLNFDAKLRRQSIEPIDLFYAHIGAMDAFALGLKNAAALRRDGRLDELKQKRYAGWVTKGGKATALGKRIRAMGLSELEEHVIENGEPELGSGRQEKAENILNDVVFN